jgi:hypothetical protein
MNPRVEYEMTEADLKRLLEACKPTIVMQIGSYSPPTPQDNANHAWDLLGSEMGFDSLTVRPIEGKGLRFFTAVPSETGAQRSERVARESEAKRLASIAEHKEAIAKHEAALRSLSATAGGSK